jgi:hypothetical protein
MPRFRARLVTSENRFFRCLSYIHDNPLHRKLCNGPARYSWSGSRLIEAGHWDEFLALRLSRDELDEAFPRAVLAQFGAEAPP